MNYQEYSNLLLPVIENSINRILLSELGSDHPELTFMLCYHMGWEGEGAGLKAQGKRIRPLILLLSSIAYGNNWEDYLSLASSVELVHNFSLIHDDIEDNSPLRRGRDTLWIRWGIPQALNTGDLLFTIAHKAVLASADILGDKNTLEAARLLHDTCIQLTKGQYLDMDFEKRIDITSDDYLKMIQGKTAALFGCTAQLGVINAPIPIRNSLRNFGYSLGMAFQIQDDILGLWGDTSQTGKSVDSDLVSGKKTFPILYSLQNNPSIKERWIKGAITPSEAKNIASQLMEDGTYPYTKSVVEQFTKEAIHQLDSTNINNDAINALKEIATSLISRNN